MTRIHIPLFTIMVKSSIKRGSYTMFSLFSKCALCKKKEKNLRKYRNDQGKTIKVCRACTVYAERRAYRKIS